MIREMGCRIYVVGGAGDTEAGESLARQIGERCRNLCGKTDLPGLCGLLKGMDLLVGVDSGPLHWADALGVPLVGIMARRIPRAPGRGGNATAWWSRRASIDRATRAHAAGGSGLPHGLGRGYSPARNFGQTVMR